jgi:hypothetical protein
MRERETCFFSIAGAARDEWADMGAMPPAYPRIEPPRVIGSWIPPQALRRILVKDLVTSSPRLLEQAQQTAGHSRRAAAITAVLKQPADLPQPYRVGLHESHGFRQALQRPL